LEVIDAPVEMIGNKQATMADVEKAIIRAGSQLGWRMSSVKPGLIVGTIAIRSHTATVEVPYTAKSYSIKYKDSTGLDYKGTQIHPNYNGWVQNLDKGIRTQLSTM
jgi:hypothetical protein